jgi:hypothetical protein
MSIGNLWHSGFISSIHKDTLTPWYTTVANNETIEFKEVNGQQRHLNSLFIEAENTDLYIRIMPSDYCIFVPANESRSYDFEDVTSIQVMGNLGQNLRWSGQFF